MKHEQSLLRDQINRRLNVLSNLEKVVIPSAGWIRTIRLALGMSAGQLGRKLRITRQAVGDMEKREAEGNISIQALREVASVLDMQLVYALIPKGGSLDKLIEKRARELATEIVMRTSENMKLEDQENPPEYLKKAVEERTRI